ncbi:cell division protein FtsX [Nitrosomonas cryotolerans]|uniref:Cell division protein FtsX n=1 Tax=Nitrosomonas cryotolerans ATCC 49181 TaxID=1131553 RepID=A0A1N6H569_9PROT|nr:permease-like cell division protein FtsX [Nitrosomonas cryotolerans]SFP71869.1 cell division protein FtsX [Nitrosomonas cryotolerans]SIO14924.1 cell division protein FtsX [Nitrosomonas cryotolerans ATCC 49181]
MMKAWLIQHWHASALTITRFFSTPIASLLSIIVIGIAFSLPVGVYTLLVNIQSFSGEMVGSSQLSLFFKLTANKADIEKVEQRLTTHSQIEHFEFVPKAVALRQLEQSSGLTDVVSNLAHNPLPDAFIVHARSAPADILEELRLSIQAWPEIEYVQFDSAWANRLDALLKLGQFAVLMLATVLSIALVMVMFNTIRLQILTKRDEIEVSKLIGATDSFIRRPFLYFGAIQGLAGGVTAWLIIALGIHIINDKLVVLTQLYAIDFHLQHLSTEDSISLLLFSSWLGWLGARLSVASYLWQIEPK